LTACVLPDAGDSGMHGLLSGGWLGCRLLLQALCATSALAPATLAGAAATGTFRWVLGAGMPGLS
jgi:hypothetical protein